MDPARAAVALTLLRPRSVLAMHWGTLWPIGLRRLRRDMFEAPLRTFAEIASTVAPDVHVVALEPGDGVTLDGAETALSPSAERPR